MYGGIFIKEVYFWQCRQRVKSPGRSYSCQQVRASQLAGDCQWAGACQWAGPYQWAGPC